MKRLCSDSGFSGAVLMNSNCSSFLPKRAFDRRLIVLWVTGAIWRPITLAHRTSATCETVPEYSWLLHGVAASFKHAANNLLVKMDTKVWFLATGPPAAWPIAVHCKHMRNAILKVCVGLSSRCWFSCCSSRWQWRVIISRGWIVSAREYEVRVPLYSQVYH